MILISATLITGCKNVMPAFDGRVDSLDKVPEGLRDYFTAEKDPKTGEDTGFFIPWLNPDPNGYGFDNVQGYKTTISKVRGERDGMQELVESYKDDDGNRMDAKAVGAKLKELATLKANQTDAEKNEAAKWAAKESALKAQWEEKFRTQATQITTLGNDNVSLRKSIASDRALRAAGVLPEYHDLMETHLNDKMAEKKVGDNTVMVMRENGVDLPTARTGSTDSMLPDEYAKTVLTKRFPGCFAGPDAAGSGAPGGGKDGDGGSAGDAGGLSIRKADLDSPEKVQAVVAQAREKGIDPTTIPVIE